MNKLEVALFPNLKGWAFADASSFCKAEASPEESFSVLAALSSAKNSLEREIASCMIVAIIGVTIAKKSSSNRFHPSLSLPPNPPNIAAKRAIIAI